MRNRKFPDFACNEPWSAKDVGRTSSMGMQDLQGMYVAGRTESGCNTAEDRVWQIIDIELRNASERCPVW